MKKSDKITWRRTARINARALKLLYKNYPQTVLSRILYVIWTALAPYAGIYLAALIIDELAGARNTDRLVMLVLITISVAAAISLVTALLNKWKNAQSSGQWYNFEHIFAEKVSSLDYVDIDKGETADLLSNIRQCQNGGGWGLYRLLSNCEDMFSALFTMLGGIALTVTLFASRVPDSAGEYTVLNSPLFIVAVVAVLLLVSWGAPALMSKVYEFWAKSASTHNLGNRLFSFFGRLGLNKDVATDMRIYGQQMICRKYNTDKSDTFGSEGLFARYSRGRGGVLCALSGAVSVIFTGVAYAFVGLKAWAGAFGLGSVTQYVASITKISTGLSKLLETLGDARNNTPFLENIFKFLDTPNTMYQGSLTVEKRSDRKYNIEFKNVSFRYPGTDTYALKNVNIKFQVGSRLAVVGMNGSGKTTFIKLLCRLYDPTEGEILLNGINVKKYRYDEYMNIFSVVFQDFKLFALPLGENVACRTNYDSALAEDCLIKSGFGERLKELPAGLDTYLYKDYDSSGVDVSGGEAQKIAIARSLYKDAPFIILDEPTAALDAVAEAEIYSKFDEIAGDKTAIYISHRLSSCKFCDEIAVFDGGAVVQYGSHEQLVADETGKYFVLWHAQAQYYAAPSA